MKIKVQCRMQRGFSLIELLVVIAIIALLAAVLFPVFATVRENGRESNSMSNMHDISSKLELYHLDTQHYPPVLFGFAVPAPGGSGYVPMSQALTSCQQQGNCGTYLPGLYPEYVNNLTEFQDPNPEHDPNDATAVVGLTNNFLCAGNNSTTDDQNCGTQPPGTLVAAKGTLNNGAVNPQEYYTDDNYDVSPQVMANGSDQVSPTQYVIRYQTSWTSINADFDCNTPASMNGIGASLGYCPGQVAGDPQVNYYVDQLRWRNPPGETYVTCETDHTKQAGKELVLLQDGTVEKIDASLFGPLDNPAGNASDSVGSVGPVTGCTVTPTPPATPEGCDVSQATFWQISPQP